jgi:hypothetical protein
MKLFQRAIITALSNSLANGVSILQAALTNHRTVVIVYAANGQKGGKIVSARYG